MVGFHLLGYMQSCGIFVGYTHSWVSLLGYIWGWLILVRIRTGLHYIQGSLYLLAYMQGVYSYCFCIGVGDTQSWEIPVGLHTGLGYTNLVTCIVGLHVGLGFACWVIDGDGFHRQLGYTCSVTCKFELYLLGDIQGSVIPVGLHIRMGYTYCGK